MSGWHPQPQDGGIPPNPATPTSPAQAYAPSALPIDTDALYYGNGCDVRLRPAVLNTLISEMLSLIDRVGLAYHSAQLINLRRGVEYINQKGLPKWVVLNPQATPVYMYVGTPDPPVLNGLNNGMVLTVLPTAANQGLVKINVGTDWVPVRRNDSAELKENDWPAGIPQTINFYNGIWYQTGLVLSQGWLASAAPDASWSVQYARRTWQPLNNAQLAVAAITLEGPAVDWATAAGGIVTLKESGLYALSASALLRCDQVAVREFALILYIMVNNGRVAETSDLGFGGAAANVSSLSAAYTRFLPAGTTVHLQVGAGDFAGGPPSVNCGLYFGTLVITRLG